MRCASVHEARCSARRPVRAGAGSSPVHGAVGPATWGCGHNIRRLARLANSAEEEGEGEEREEDVND
eukprot:7325150-Pyramimonas_sp.AAC.1